MRTIAVLNQKGGVGKTTTVANTAAALASLGQRVLVVDFDPQGHLTIHLGVDAETDGNGSYDVLTKSVPIEDVLINVRPNLYLLGANIDLVGAESELVSVVGRETIFSEALKPLRDKFDYMLIDCPPSLGLLSLNALAAVNEVFIPIQPHFLALQGFGKLLQTVTLVSNRINPALRITAILLCMFDTRVTLSSEVKADIDNFLENARRQDTPWSDAVILPIHVRRNIKLAEAPSHGKTIFEYEPDCNGAEDYKAIAEYIHTQMLDSADRMILFHIQNAPELPIQSHPEPAVYEDQAYDEENTCPHEEHEEAPDTESNIRLEQQPQQKTEPQPEQEPEPQDNIQPGSSDTEHLNDAEQHTESSPDEQPAVPKIEIKEIDLRQIQNERSEQNYDFEKLNYKPRTE